MNKAVISKFFSIVLVVVLFSEMLIPVYAESSDYTGTASSFWDQLLQSCINGASSLPFVGDSAGDAVQGVAGLLSGAICSSSPDNVHHATTVAGDEMYQGLEGNYTYATCTYCHDRFKVYASDLQQSYEAQVKELPAQGYNSAGKLIWQPTFADCDIKRSIIQIFGNAFCFEDLPRNTSNYSITYDISSNTFLGAFDEHGLRSQTILDYHFYFPANGLYRRMESIATSYSGFHGTEQKNIDGQLFFSAETSYFRRSVDSLFDFYVFFDHPFSTGEYALNLREICYFPIYEFSPDNPVGDTYNITTRPTSITGNYGIIGDNGQITQVTDNSSIVNETNNTFYNPSTGQTSTMTDWTYNYEDRSYQVTLESGDTVTVTYGDENITIIQGGDTYNIYYMAPGGTDTPGQCTHSWTETSTTPATCTVPGQKLLTCSLCSQTKAETLPALGHTWTVKQTVTTQYDETGALTQEGYTIFECSRCGEQYKSTDGGAPPGGGSTSGSGSSGGVFSGIFGLLVDFLSFFWNTFRDFVGEGVKGFLSALMDGTSDIFGLLNPFDWSA